MWTRRSPEALLALLLMLAASSAPAADGTAAERARIARERADVEAQSRVAERDCAQRFTVSSCVSQVRAERRSKVQSLDRQSALLDEMQRRSRAAERLERLRQRQAAASAAPSIVAAPARLPRAPAAPAPEVDPTATGSTRQDAAAARNDAEQHEAAQRAAAGARRAREAQAHREAVEQRNRERRAARKPSLPLPPGGTPASSPR